MRTRSTGDWSALTLHFGSIYHTILLAIVTLTVAIGRFSQLNRRRIFYSPTSGANLLPIAAGFDAALYFPGLFVSSPVLATLESSPFQVIINNNNL